MRVIAGSAKGRILKAVSGQNTRPTTDKVKESIFNIIGPYFDGGIVLDLFAGTGGLGIEALSRGMNQGIFIDHHKLSIETINKNIRATEMDDRVEVYQNDAIRALNALKKRELCFDLVFLDPPYRMKNLEEILDFLIDHQLLNENAKVVTEHDAKYHLTNLDQLKGLEQIRDAIYGDIGVTIFQKK
ncbi:16S rRNA (guanine(966)-N(2))-methyltransferase RsmD [Tepidibacillus marianensis]|uniref:16S rRNA (guanine(966)-N(2))-methyltransferase RsmD n=1 Tax=Tepidibacillus marianensis TaxID=3131995 RepID=UPI0030CEC609